MSKALHDLQIKPPSNEIWWQSVQSKQEGFHAASVDVTATVDHLRQSLASSTDSLVDLERQLKEIADDAAQSMADLDAQKTLIDREYDDLQPLIAGVAKPFASLALELETIVRYAPVLLASAIIYFLMRFVTLQRNQIQLEQACFELGYSDRAIRVYFQDGRQPIPSPQSFGSNGWHSVSIAVLLAGLYVLVLVSAGRILMSPVLSNDTLIFTYAFAVSAMSIAFCLSAAPLLKRIRDLK